MFADGDDEVGEELPMEEEEVASDDDANDRGRPYK